jgi:transcriptional regulator with PAS, ATPase and Fis domain
MDLLFSVMDNENDLTLTDAAGVVIRVSDSYEKNFHVQQEEVIGRSVFELEQEGIFYPSVTAIVLREKRRATVMQRNRNGVYGLTTGIPILDGNGEIEYVISFNSIDIAGVSTIYDKYERLSDLMREYSSEIHQLRMRETNDKEFITRSSAMRAIKELVINVADTKANILLTGETGVGKSLLAKLIHQYSRRHDGPFISINCAAIPENLLESELFGYEKGAFTGAGSKGKPGKIELAENGTLFLDEVGELSPDMQIKLLHVIQDKSLTRVGGIAKIHVDFRLVSATNRDLRAAIAEGRFREDLFYRLNVIPIQIPPLRERPEDIVPLVAWFLSIYNAEYGKNVSFDSGAYKLLEGLPWHGNTRQVENFVERIVVTATEDVMTEDLLLASADLLRQELPGIGSGTDAAAGAEDGAEAGTADKETEGSLPERIEAYERGIFTEAYERHRTSVAVAKALGISQSTAARRLRKYVPGYTDGGRT